MSKSVGYEEFSVGLCSLLQADVNETLSEVIDINLGSPLLSLLSFVTTGSLSKQSELLLIAK